MVHLSTSDSSDSLPNVPDLDDPDAGYTSDLVANNKHFYQ